MVYAADEQTMITDVTARPDFAAVRERGCEPARGYEAALRCADAALRATRRRDGVQANQPRSPHRGRPRAGSTRFSELPKLSRKVGHRGDRRA
jgi:hypothetical protein